MLEREEESFPQHEDPCRPPGAEGRDKASVSDAPPLIKNYSSASITKTFSEWKQTDRSAGDRNRPVFSHDRRPGMSSGSR